MRAHLLGATPGTGGSRAVAAAAATARRAWLWWRGPARAAAGSQAAYASSATGGVADSCYTLLHAWLLLRLRLLLSLTSFQERWVFLLQHHFC
jgi:hypothetical protein